MEINGIAHVILTVGRFAECRPFYDRLLTHFGLMRVIDSESFVYYMGGKTAVGIHASAPEHAGERFVQARVGLHHLCFRARSREDVDSVHALLLELGAKIVHPPEEAEWAPGYYSVLFEDPDGVRLEVNYVPGKGIFQQ
jgi:catechol 2,3-dioxygenase-like lactoylglutathione lyase family enzyme